MNDLESRVRASLEEFGKRIHPGPPPAFDGARDVVDVRSGGRDGRVILAAAAVLVLAVAGGVVLAARTPDRRSTHPVDGLDRVTAGDGTVGGADTADADAVGPVLRLPSQFLSDPGAPMYEQVGPAPAGAPPRTVWRLDPTVVTEAMVRRFGGALGFETDSVVAESTPGMWSVHSSDGQRSLYVSQADLSSWSLQSGGENRPGPGAGPSGAAAVPLPVEEAQLRTEEALDTMGFEDGSYEVEAVSMPWGAYALAWLTLDGVRSSLSMSFGLDGTGAFTWGEGILVRPVAIGSYELVDSATAAARLSHGWPSLTGTGVQYSVDPYFSWSGPGYWETIGDARRYRLQSTSWFGSECAAQAAPDTTSPGQAVDCPAEPAVQLTVDGPSFGLVMASSQGMLLVPAYQYRDEQGRLFMATALAPERVKLGDLSSEP